MQASCMHCILSQHVIGLFSIYFSPLLWSMQHCSFEMIVRPLHHWVIFYYGKIRTMHSSQIAWRWWYQFCGCMAAVWKVPKLVSFRMHWFCLPWEWRICVAAHLFLITESTQLKEGCCNTPFKSVHSHVQKLHPWVQTSIVLYVTSEECANQPVHHPKGVGSKWLHAIAHIPSPLAQSSIGQVHALHAGFNILIQNYRCKI